MHEAEQLILNEETIATVKKTGLLTFFSIVMFYFFESAQMSYFNVLAPGFLSHGTYNQTQIASLSAAYYYGDMLGLLPAGLALDYFPLRKVILWAIFFSIIGAFLLLIGHNLTLEWFARFMSGFFGGTISFLGGIRILSNLFPQRFTYYMGLFLAAGMFGGLICQYPLLMMVTYMGTQGAILVMALLGVVVGIINLLYLHPVTKKTIIDKSKQYQGSIRKMCLEIVSNFRNWFDCIMIVLLDLPVSVIGTLWGVVLLMGFYHFTAAVSAWIVMSLFAGLMIGLPIMGALADRYNYSGWIIILGGGASFIISIIMLLMPHSSAWLIAALFFGLGIFSSCQTLGFTWITKNMRPELIGSNSAFNSMIFMGGNGVVKQVSAWLLYTSPLVAHSSSAGNLFILISGAMLVAVVYVAIRKIMFKDF